MDELCWRQTILLKWIWNIMNNRFTIWKLGQVFNRFMVWFETHSSCILTRGITLSSLNGTAIAFQEFFAELFLPRGEQWIKANKCRAFKNIAIWQTLLSSGASRGTWPWSSSAWLQPAGIGAFKINLNILFVAKFVFVQYLYLCNICNCAIFVFVQYLYLCNICVCSDTCWDSF